MGFKSLRDFAPLMAFDRTGIGTGPHFVPRESQRCSLSGQNRLQDRLQDRREIGCTIDCKID